MVNQQMENVVLEKIRKYPLAINIVNKFYQHVLEYEQSKNKCCKGSLFAKQRGYADGQNAIRRIFLGRTTEEFKETIDHHPNKEVDAHDAWTANGRLKLLLRRGC